MKISKWKKLSSKIVYKGFRNIVRETFLLPDGRKDDFDAVIQGNAVGIFLKNSKNEFLLVKQYRPGPENIFYSIPGGMIEKGMNPVAVAKKELLEETGYTAKNFKLLAKVPKDGYSKDINYLFYCDSPKFVGLIENDVNEWLDAKFYSESEIDKIMKAGQMGNSLTNFWIGYRMKK